MTTATSSSITLEEFLKLPETKVASKFIADQIYQILIPQIK
ncbi:hypothetical protein [Nostoc sp.]